MKHTPTPWVINQHWIVDKDQNPICSCGNDEYSQTEQEKQNAAFICQAVNNHEALVEAAKAAIDYIFDSDVRNPRLTLACKALQQAIQNATKGE